MTWRTKILVISKTRDGQVPLTPSWRTGGFRTIIAMSKLVQAYRGSTSSWHMRLPGASLEFFQGYAAWVYSVYHSLCENRRKTFPKCWGQSKNLREVKRDKQVNCAVFQLPLIYFFFCFVFLFFLLVFFFLCIFKIFSGTFWRTGVKVAKHPGMLLNSSPGLRLRKNVAFYTKQDFPAISFPRKNFPQPIMSTAECSLRYLLLFPTMVCLFSWIDYQGPRFEGAKSRQIAY